MPAGENARRIATLMFWMVGSALVIWLLVMVLAVLATTNWKRAWRLPRLNTWVASAGVLLPTVLLGALLGYSLPLLRNDEPAPGLRIEVTGERWWWRVRYAGPGGMPVELANEIRLPVGVTAEFLLSSPEIIHSFWIPSLAGKVDMIPGRVNRLHITPTHTGSFRGVCAEFCGSAHAQMAFAVEVMEPDAFSQWLAAQAAPAVPEGHGAGERAFAANGCGGCHAIRGSEHRGSIGPDLTHVGSRLTIAAGARSNEIPELHRWLAATETIKPGVRMPSYSMLPETELAALAAWLGTLE